jgi:cytochrome c-type biogenesis protein CcsB
MTSTDLNSLVTFAYLVSAVVYLVAYVASKSQSLFIKSAFFLVIGVCASHTAAIAFRWIESYHLGIGHAPLSNLYESLVFFAWAMAVALIVVRFRFGADIVVLCGMPFVFIVMASTFLVDGTIRPLIPALQSNWLVAHVITCFLGYAGFTASFVAAVILLAATSFTIAAKFLPRRELLDDIVYRSILVGFPLLTIGIITGAAWADYAWGTYWSWDPKETWSLITWLVYAAFLHARLARGWSGRRTAALSVIGFLAVLFTYFGVNYLPGLHSYF